MGTKAGGWGWGEDIVSRTKEGGGGRMYIIMEIGESPDQIKLCVTGVEIEIEVFLNFCDIIKSANYGSRWFWHCWSKN